MGAGALDSPVTDEVNQPAVSTSPTTEALQEKEIRNQTMSTAVYLPSGKTRAKQADPPVMELCVKGLTDIIGLKVTAPPLPSSITEADPAVSISQLNHSSESRRRSTATSTAVYKQQLKDNIAMYVQQTENNSTPHIGNLLQVHTDKINESKDAAHPYAGPLSYSHMESSTADPGLAPQPAITGHCSLDHHDVQAPRPEHGRD